MNPIIAAFETQVWSAPDRLAVATHSRRHSYLELASKAALLATRMLERPAGQVVVAAADDAIDVAISVLAAVATARPLSVVAARHGQDALDKHVVAVDAATLLVPGGLDVVAPGVEVLCLPEVLDGTRSSTDPGTFPSRALAPDDVIILGATSGSTGAPKLVRRTARCVLDDPAASGDLHDRFGSEIRFRAFFAGGGTARALLRSVMSGDSMVCVDPRTIPASQVLPLLRDERVSIARLVPSVLRGALSAAASHLQLPDLRVLASGGEPLRWEDVALARRHMAPGSQIIHTYGSTEVSGIAARVIPFDEPLGIGVVPVGRARPGRRVWIAGDEGEPVGPGEPGRVVIEGRLGGTIGSFEDLSDGVQRYWSEDRGRIDGDGELHLLGRSDAVVKVGAVRVDLSVVEELLRSIPQVRNGAVVAVPSSGRVVLVAHVELHDGADHGDPRSTVAAIRDRLIAHLESAAAPARIVLHAAGLPLLPSGKIDRRRLAGQVASSEGPVSPG